MSGGRRHEKSCGEQNKPCRSRLGDAAIRGSNQSKLQVIYLNAAAVIRDRDRLDARRINRTKESVIDGIAIAFVEITTGVVVDLPERVAIGIDRGEMNQPHAIRPDDAGMSRQEA